MEEPDYSNDDFISWSDLLLTILLLSLIALPALWKKPAGEIDAVRGGGSSARTEAPRVVRVSPEGLELDRRPMLASEIRGLRGEVVLRLSPETESADAAEVLAKFTPEAKVRIQFERR